MSKETILRNYIKKEIKAQLLEGLKQKGKIFLCIDKVRKEKVKLPLSQIQETWDLEEIDDTTEQSLGDFLDNCYIGDVWRTRTEEIECIKII